MNDEASNHVALSEAIDRAEKQPHIVAHLAREGCLHVHTLVTAFAVGVLSADPWHKNYQVPPHFEKVLNAVAKAVADKFDGEVVRISLGNVEKFWREAVGQMPEYLAWNDWPGHPDAVFAFVDRCSPTPTKREFIDLNALLRNGANHIRWQWDREEAFDREFKEKYGEPASTSESA